MVLIAVSLLNQAEVIEEPGAKMSTQAPWFENELTASVLVEEPTVIAFGVLDGE